MRIDSAVFNELEVNDSDIIWFEDGLYGFPDIKQYALIHNPDQENPFKWLHAVGERLCFVVIDPRHVIPDYDFELIDDNIKRLGASMSTPFMLLSIVVIPDKMEEMTANLKSPIVINLENQKAMQLVLDEEKYEIRHRIIQ